MIPDDNVRFDLGQSSGFSNDDGLLSQGPSTSHFRISLSIHSTISITIPSEPLDGTGNITKCVTKSLGGQLPRFKTGDPGPSISFGYLLNNCVPYGHHRATTIIKVLLTRNDL